MNKYIDRILIAIDCAVLVVIAFFGYEMYQVYQMTDKPFVVYLLILSYTVGVSVSMRYYETMSQSARLRDWMLPLCWPYMAFSRRITSFFDRVPWGKSVMCSSSSCLYSQFFYLPVLPMNLSMGTFILMVGWPTLDAVVYNCIVLALIFLFVGLFTYTALEIVFRTISYLVTRIVSENRFKNQRFH